MILNHREIERGRIETLMIGRTWRKGCGEKDQACPAIFRMAVTLTGKIAIQDSFIGLFKLAYS